MSTGQLPPNSLVPTSGLYSCTVCWLSNELAKETGADPFVIAMAYAKETGVDPDIVSALFKGCEEPIVRKRFNASEMFDECPIHKAATGWLPEEEGMASSAAPERSTSKRKWWQFWKVADSQHVATAAAPTKTNVDTRVAKPEGSPEQTTCMACGERTPLPRKDAPWGSALICANCHAPLIPHDPANPLPTSPQRLEIIYGMTGRGLEHPRCPFCNTVNYAVVFPAKGMTLGWFAVAEPENPAGYAFKVECVNCAKEFYVEWDEDPY